MQYMLVVNFDQKKFKHLEEQLVGLQKQLRDELSEVSRALATPITVPLVHFVNGMNIMVHFGAVQLLDEKWDQVELKQLTDFELQRVASLDGPGVVTLERMTETFNRTVLLRRIIGNFDTMRCSPITRNIIEVELQFALIRYEAEFNFLEAAKRRRSTPKVSTR